MGGDRVGIRTGRGQLRPARRRDCPGEEGVVRWSKGEEEVCDGCPTVGRGSREEEGLGWGRGRGGEGILQRAGETWKVGCALCELGGETMERGLRSQESEGGSEIRPSGDLRGNQRLCHRE